MEDIQLDDSLAEAWPKEFSELKDLEKLLRCNICKDFMKTALITGCSHLFCSYCIRQSIQYRNQCPACFVELYDNQLRPERTLDEVVRIFTSVKRKLLKRLQISYAACPGDEEDGKPPAMPYPCTVEQDNKDEARTSSVLLFNSPRKSCVESPAVLKHRTVPDMFSPKRVPSSQLFKPCGSVTKREPGITSSVPSTAAGSSVACPVCSVDIPDKHINLHLDECLARANGAPPKSQPMNKPSRKPLPKLVLSLMKDKELKHYCKEYGLSTLGDRKSLVSRIQRYTTLYNSECDSLCPRSKQDIIRQIEKEEKSITSNAATKPLFSQVTRKTDPKIIEEVNSKYLQDNKTAFQKLIENMKGRDGSNIVRCPRPSVTRILSDDEEDVKPGPSDCKASTSITEATTPKSRYCSKNDADGQNTTPARQKKQHAPPLSPEIQVAPSPSQNRSLSPLLVNHLSSSLVNDTSPIILQGSSRSSLTASTPILFHSNPKFNSSTCTNTNNLSSQKKVLDPSLSLKCNKTTPSVHSNENKRSDSSCVDKIESFFSNLSPPSSKKQSSVHCEPSTSPFRTDKGRGAESPDLFLAEAIEEEELPPSSPDLLGNLNSSCSLSQKSQITARGHFVFSDSDSDIDNNKTKLTSSHGNENSTVNGFHGNRPGRESGRLLEGGDSEDDEDFLQLVQNKRGKRKPKQGMFSPRTTRSKRVKP